MKRVNLLIDTPLGWFDVYGDLDNIQGSRWVQDDDAVVGTGLSSVSWKKDVEHQVKAYFNGDRTFFELPLQFLQEPFIRDVSFALSKIRTTDVIHIDDFIASHNLGNYNKTVVRSALEIIDFSLLLPTHRIELDSSGDQHVGVFDENILRLRQLEEGCYAA